MTRPVRLPSLSGEASNWKTGDEGIEIVRRIGRVNPGMNSTPAWIKTLYAPVYWVTGRFSTLHDAYASYSIWCTGCIYDCQRYQSQRKKPAV
jgi:hypothetical protein